jgi:hypothetical protein
MGPQGYKRIRGVYDQLDIDATLAPSPRQTGQQFITLTVRRSTTFEDTSLNGVLGPLVNAGFVSERPDPIDTSPAPRVPTDDLESPLLSWTVARGLEDGVEVRLEDLHNGTSL